MKKIAIMQPYLFPYIGYFQLLKSVDEFVIYDDVQHIKRGWINRNNYLINGEKRLLTVSLEGASTSKLINEINVQDDFINYKKSIFMAYAKAPYFNEVAAVVNEVCGFEDRNLAKFIAHSLHVIADYLKIGTPLIFSSELNNNKALRGQDKIIEICKLRDARQYINPIGGREIYDRSKFDGSGIILNFIRPIITPYTQYKSEFIPGLSIIDVLMFNAPSKVSIMLDQYELL